MFTNQSEYSNPEGFDLENRVCGLIFFGISIICCIYTLYLSVKLRLYKQIINEFMIYVLISEILFALSRFFCLFRSANNTKIILGDSFNNWTMISQLFFSLYCNIWTLLSVLFHTIKINDAISKRTQWFAFRSKRIIFRLIIFITPLIITTISLCINFELNSDKDDCNNFYCTFREPLNYILYGIYCGIVFGIFIFIFLAHRFLKMMIENPRASQSEEIIQKMKKLACKIWIYPLTNFVYWIIREIMQITSTENKVVVLCFILFTSFRGIIYTLLFIFTQESLIAETFGRIWPRFKKEEEKSLGKEELSMVQLENDEVNQNQNIENNIKLDQELIS